MALARPGGYVFVEFPELPTELSLSHFKIPHCNMIRNSEVVRMVADESDISAVNSGDDFVLFRKSTEEEITVRVKSSTVSTDKRNLPFKWRVIRVFVKSALMLTRNA